MSSPLRRKRRRADKTGRSIGGERHVRLHYWMMNSPAWQTLSLPGRCLLIELYALYNGENNGELFLSVREAARRLRIGKNTAGDLITELRGRGFIRPRQEGSFHYKERHATAWVLTEFGFAGQLPTKEFMHWQPAENSEAGPSHGDRLSPTEGQIDANGTDETLICPSHGDSFDGQVGVICPSHGDTDKLPPPAGKSGSATTMQPTVQAITSTSPTDLDQPTIREAGRQRHGQDGHNPDAPSLLDYINAQTKAAAPVNQTSPTDRLRVDLKAKLAIWPKGTHKRLAERVGLKSCTLSNFLSKGGPRYSPNACAEGLLREWVDGRLDLDQGRNAA